MKDNNENLSEKDFSDLLNTCYKKMISLSYHEALTYIIQFICDELDCDRVSIFENQTTMFFKNCYTYESPQAKLFPPPSESFSLEGKYQQIMSLMAGNKPFFLEQEQFSLFFSNEKTHNPQFNIQSMAISPIFTNNALSSALIFLNPHLEKSLFLSLIESLTPVISHSIQKREDHILLQQLSFHDPLTGALNRNALFRDIDRFVSSAPHGLIYGDVCGLKRTNDTKGHREGDKLLVSIYETICKHFDPSTIYRTGGDEYIIFCANVSKEDMLQKIENLRQTILEENHSPVLAIGSFWEETSSTSSTSMFDLAEIDMYRDKRTIYNRLASAQNSCLSKQSSENENSNFLREYIDNYLFDAETMLSSISTLERPYYIYFGDLEKNRFYVSDRLKIEFGFESNLIDDLIPRWGNCIIDQDKDMFFKDISEVLSRKKGHHSLAYQVRNVFGEIKWIHCQGKALWKNGKPVFFSGIITDLQEEKNIDPITGLWRSTAILGYLKQNLNASSTIIGIGLSEFSFVNSSIGRKESDTILKNICQMLQVRLGNQFSFFRIDSVKFCAIPRTNLKFSFETVTESIRTIVDAIYMEYNLCLQRSCGVCFLNINKKNEISDELISVLGNLITQAKVAPSKYIEEDFSSICNNTQSSSLFFNLNESISNNFEGFYINVQPIINPLSSRIIGGEVLLRWRHNGTVVSPGEFIPLLEKHNMIQPVGNWVFEEAVKVTSEMLKIEPDFLISVNISYLQILRPDFFDFIMKTVKKYQIPPQSFILELTETNPNLSAETLSQFIAKTKEVGFQFSIDDLGDGYASLNFLFECPSDIIKIPRALTKNFFNSPLNDYLIRTIIFACHESNKKICVEGIETETERDAILSVNADFVQGFYYHQPLSFDQFKELIINQLNEDKNS